jgi:MoaA/NifB/PqqE/SkfB family radical SAM enzyme
MLKPSTGQLLKLNRVISNSRLKFLAVYFADLLQMRHTIVRFDPVNVCNLRCGMCFFSNDSWREANTGGRFTDDEIEMLAKEFFPRAVSLYIGAAAEVSMYRKFINIVQKGKQYGIPFVSLTSNGQLITKEHIRAMVYLGLDELTLSTHGVRAETYERLMKNASHAKFMRLLGMVDEIRQESSSRVFSLRLNYTINPDNTEELNDFFEIYGNFDIDTIQVRPMSDFGETAYKHTSALEFVPKYQAAVAVMKRECKRRGIHLLYNDNDPAFLKDNELSPVYTEGVLRIVRSGNVWSADYNWRTESYAAYAARSGFRRKMLDYATGRKLIELRPNGKVSSQVL